MMSRRIINLVLIISFQFCYLQWPPNNSMFIFQVEHEIISKSENLISNITHPLIITGIFAQMMLILGILFSNFNKKWNSLGVILLGTIVLLILLVGILSLKFKIISSTIPYSLVSIYYFKKIKSI